MATALARLTPIGQASYVVGRHGEVLAENVLAIPLRSGFERQQ